MAPKTHCMLFSATVEKNVLVHKISLLENGMADGGRLVAEEEHRITLHKGNNKCGPEATVSVYRDGMSASERIQLRPGLMAMFDYIPRVFNESMVIYGIGTDSVVIARDPFEQAGKKEDLPCFRVAEDGSGFEPRQPWVGMKVWEAEEEEEPLSPPHACEWGMVGNV